MGYFNIKINNLIMIIAITGAPGTGKDTVSKIIADKLDFELVDLNQLAKDKKLFIGYDEKRKCEIVDIKKLNQEIKKIKRDAIIQSHYAHEISSDIIIVLRANPAELRKRLGKRGWPPEKIKENIEAEIMEVCKDEALQKTRKVFEIDTSAEEPEKSAEEAANIIYREMFSLKKNVKLPGQLLEHFKKPYGKVFRNAEEFLKNKTGENELLITIGDVASYNLIEECAEPGIIVIDNKVRREPFNKKIRFKGREFKAINAPGEISRNLWNTIKKSVLEAKKEKIKISVLGEEDLAVLPFVIMAPLGSVVLYGQPELEFGWEKIEGGLVAINVDLGRKKNAVGLFKKMLKMQ